MVITKTAHAKIIFDLENEDGEKILYMFFEVQCSQKYQATARTRKKPCESLANAHRRALAIVNAKLKRIPGFIEDALNATK